MTLLLYVRNVNSTIYAETMCAERSHQALLSEYFELFLVGNSPAWPCALQLALEEFSCITELTVSHCANNIKEGILCWSPVHWAGPMISDIYPHQLLWAFHLKTTWETRRFLEDSSRRDMQNLSFSKRRGSCFVPEQGNEIMGTLSKESHLVKVTTTDGVEGKRNQKRQYWEWPREVSGPCLLCLVVFYSRFNSFRWAIALTTGKLDLTCTRTSFQWGG